MSGNPDMTPDGQDQPVVTRAEGENAQSSPMSERDTTIPGHYKQAGYFMTLLKREGNAVMYADASQTYFEVHKVRVAKPKTVFGKLYPEREILAGNEDFGVNGWACVSRERAEFRFANIVAESKS